MFRIIIISILLLIPGQLYAQNWSFHISIEEPGTGYIKYGPKGVQNIGEAFSQAPPNIDINKIDIGMLHQLESNSIQNDLFSFFRKNLPEQLEKALQAAQQNKNPNLLNLEYFFGQALLKTQYVKDLNSKLKGYGYRVSAAYHEDIILTRENDQFKFDALISFITAPIENT